MDFQASWWTQRRQTQRGRRRGLEKIHGLFDLGNVGSGLAGLSSAVLCIRQVFICMFLKRFVRTEESNRQERKDSMGRASI